jgi:hypothetical protein
MGYAQELMDGELLALPEDLVRPEVQISQKIFTVSDYEVHDLGTELEAWVPSDTKRIMLSLVV